MKIEDLRKMSVNDLKSRLVDNSENLQKYRFQKSIQQLEDYKLISEMKKETAKSYLAILSNRNTKIINIRSVEKNKIKEGPSFNDYENILVNYNIVGKYIRVCTYR